MLVIIYLFSLAANINKLPMTKLNKKTRLGYKPQQNLRFRKSPPKLPDGACSASDWSEVNLWGKRRERKAEGPKPELSTCPISEILWGHRSTSQPACNGKESGSTYYIDYAHDASMETRNQ